MSNAETPQRVADAAIKLFLNKGYTGTSIADICDASGVTTGSIYHFFGSKAGIAIHVWQDAIAGWKSASEAHVAADSAKAYIKASISGLLHWARANPAHFGVYDEILMLSRSLDEFSPIRQEIEQGHAVSRDLYATWVSANAVKNIPWLRARALMMGPALELLRSGGDVDDTDIAKLSEAAWAAVRT